jgi:hypothetical protein
VILGQFKSLLLDERHFREALKHLARAQGCISFTVSHSHVGVIEFQILSLDYIVLHVGRRQGLRKTYEDSVQLLVQLFSEYHLGHCCLFHKMLYLF